MALGSSSFLPKHRPPNRVNSRSLESLVRCAMICAASTPATPSRAMSARCHGDDGRTHHLLARVAVKLPSSVSSGDFDSISEPLSLAGEFGSGNLRSRRSAHDRFRWDRGRLLSVRAAGHVGDDDVSVQARVGTIAVFNTARGPRRDVIEARGDDSLPGRLNPSAAPRYERRHSGSVSFAARSPGARRRSRSTVKGGACQILFSFWYLPGEHFISLPLTHCFDPFGLSSFPQGCLKVFRKVALKLTCISQAPLIGCYVRKKVA